MTKLTKAQRDALERALNGEAPKCSGRTDKSLEKRGLWTWNCPGGFQVTEAGREALQAARGGQ